MLNGRRFFRRFSNALIQDHKLEGSTDLPAFSFDIDGVLIRGKTILQEAREAFKLLYDTNGQQRFPVCFLTNGGGCLEAEKAGELSTWLDVDVTPDQVILSHTPMRALAKQFGDKPVLIAGRGRVLDVARSYGFRKAVTTAQLGAALEDHGATPLSRYSVDHTCGRCGSIENVSLLLADERNCQGSARETCPIQPTGIGSSAAPFAAVLFLIDPTDWGRDIQLTLDVLQSGGAPLTPLTEIAATQGTAAAREEARHRTPVPVFFSNPDLIWANHFHLNRLGQGSFATALEAIHKEVTGHPISLKFFYGKPNAIAFRCAEESLLQQAKRLYGAEVDRTALPSKLPFSHIFHVGDHPSADIAGALNAGEPWRAVLVRTGVFRGEKFDPADEFWGLDGRQPHMVVDNVLEAVKAGLHRSRSQLWHSMR